MKKLLSLGGILALLWGIMKFWPSRKESEGRAEVRVNARRARANRPRARIRARKSTTQRPHLTSQQQPRRIPRPEEVPVEV